MEEGSSSQVTNESDLLAEGRRALACKDYANAVEAFQEACQLVSTKYGPVSEKMGEPSFLYGRALLELARMENALFGSGMPQEPNNEDDQDEEDEIEEDEIEEDDDEEEKKDELSEVNESDHTPVPAEACSSSTANEGDAPVGVANDQKENEDNDDPTNLQLAWEMFEVARVIYSKSDTLDGKLRLADINSYLGEVSLESDQYEQAIEDLTTSLKIRELVLKDDDRLLAESHFQLGLAHTYAMNFEEAIMEYEKAVHVLKLRKEVLGNQLEKKDGKEMSEKIKEEISDIDELLPDIDSKISDVYEIQKKAQASSALEEADNYQSLPDNTSSSKGSTSQAATPINDISHLVRKKAKVNGTDQQQGTDDDMTLNKRKRPASDANELLDTVCEEAKDESHQPSQAKKSCVVITEQ